MGITSRAKMKLITAGVTILLSLGAAQSLSVKERVMYNLRTWVHAAAHCANAATTDGEMDHARANECRRCWAKVGDWTTEAGNAAGNECLDEYEPEFRDMCGEIMDTFAAEPTDDNGVAVDECWNQCYMRSIAGKCVEATGGASKELEFVCIGKHMQDNMNYAREKIFGEKHNFLKPNKMMETLESVFEEGRCEHANADNIERRNECNMCFHHVNEKVEEAFGEDAKNWNGKLDAYFDPSDALKVTGMWMFCADNYLAPVYSECYETIDSVVEAIEAKNAEEWEKLVTEMEACATVKQAEHYFTDCKEGAGEGVEGLISYVTCARNLTNAWIAERRPEVTDLMADYWMGGSVYSDDMM